VPRPTDLFFPANRRTLTRVCSNARLPMFPIASEQDDPLRMKYAHGRGAVGTDFFMAIIGERVPKERRRSEFPPER